MYLFPTVFLLSLLTSCKNGDESSTGLDRRMEILPVDSSTACISGQEVGPYQRFYRPQQGFVGDPMPYYNANDNKFYLF